MIIDSLRVAGSHLDVDTDLTPDPMAAGDGGARRPRNPPDPGSHPGPDLAHPDLPGSRVHAEAGYTPKPGTRRLPLDAWQANRITA